METSYSSDSMFKTAINLMKKDLIENADNIIIAFFVFSIMELTLGEVCFTKLVVGFPCPFCGLTRAGLSLIGFRLIAAYKFNPLIYFIAVLFILWCMSRYLRIIPKKLVTTLFVVLIVISIPIYLYRLTTLFPYTEPMTYNDNNLFKVVIDSIHKFTGG